MASKKKRAPDLTLEVLKDIREDVKDIRDDVRKTNLRLDGLRDETRAGFDEVGQRFEEFGRRIVDSELRTATAITDLAGTLHEIRDDLRESRALR